MILIGIMYTIMENSVFQCIDLGISFSYVEHFSAF